MNSQNPESENSAEPIKIGLFEGDGNAKDVADLGWVIPDIVSDHHQKKLFSTEVLRYNADHYLKHGESWPEGTPARLKKDFDTFSLTALGDARVPGTMAHAKPIILDFLRGNAFNDSPDSLFTNYNRRPCKLWHPDLALEPAKGDFQFKLHVIDEAGLRIEEHVTNSGNISEEILVHEYHSLEAYMRAVEKIAPICMDNGESIAVVLKSNVYNYAHLPVEKALKEKYGEINDLYVKNGKPPFLRFYNADAFSFEMVDHPERMPRNIVTDPVFGTILKGGISALNNGQLAKTPSDFYAEIGREAVSGQYICVGEIIGDGANQVGMQKHLHTARLIKANIQRAAQISVEQGWIEMSVIHNGDLYPKTAQLIERCAKEVGQEMAVIVNIISAEEFYRQCVAEPEKLNQGLFTGDNLLGDIASDTLAARSGGLGCAASISETTDGIRGRERNSYVEPVHGTAPSLKPNQINPTGMIGSVALQLEHFGFNREASALRKGIYQAIENGSRTIDMPRKSFLPGGYEEPRTTDIYGITVLANFKKFLREG
jgi:isocitrate/isopropylmalate dehydrogenase